MMVARTTLGKHFEVPDKLEDGQNRNKVIKARLIIGCMVESVNKEETGMTVIFLDLGTECIIAFTQVKHWLLRSIS